MIFFRIHLAALHYNDNSDKKQSKTKSGTPRYKVYYPKAKKGEQAVVKPTKQGPTYGKFPFGCFSCCFSLF